MEGKNAINKIHRTADSHQCYQEKSGRKERWDLEELGFETSGHL